MGKKEKVSEKHKHFNVRDIVRAPLGVRDQELLQPAIASGTDADGDGTC
jgi:hypothetical protein